jgi:hypothetical protein
MSSDTSIIELAEKKIGEHKEGLEIAGGAIVAGALLYASRGKLGNTTEITGALRRFIPEITLTAKDAASAATRSADAAGDLLTASRPQTFAEKATEKTLRMSVQTAKRVLRSLRAYDAAGPAAESATAGPGDEVRRHVFNRFLARVNGEGYVLHGSYALENQVGAGARKAVKDLDLLSVNPKLAEGSAAQISKSLADDLQRSANKDLGDGLTFTIKNEPGRRVLATVFPRMRHLMATAEAGGEHVMDIPLDVRVGGKTILPPEHLPLTNQFNGVEYSTAVDAMRKEETLAYKLYTYGNRYFGGIVRKEKDLKDIATLIQSGVNPNDTAEAMQAWTSRGYGMAPIRPFTEIMGLSYPMSQASIDSATKNFGVAKDFYSGISGAVENAPLRTDVSNSWLARSTRFLKKHAIVYPAELQ